MANEMTIPGECAGFCGATINYTVGTNGAGTSPDLYPGGFHVAYRGGHLCNACEKAVEATLRARRQAPGDRAQWILKAREAHEDDDIAIPADATVTDTEDGVWVTAAVWVRKEVVQ
jgi:hypothetical protein